MTPTKQTPLQCALDLVDACGLHSHLLDSPEIVARYNAMTIHKEGCETACEAALRIITKEYHKQAKAHASLSALNARLQVQLTAALERVAVEHRERIEKI